MGSMEKNGAPTLKEIFAGIDKIRNPDDSAGAKDPARPTSAVPARPKRFDLLGRTKSGEPVPESRPPQAADTLEEHARAAMVAAADAVIQPWLYKHLPRIIEERLSALLKDRTEEMTEALKQLVADALGQRLEPVLKQSEKRNEAALAQQVGDTVNQRLGPLLSKHVAAVEERLAIALSVRVADAVGQELEPAVRKHVAAVEDRLALAIGDRVAEVVNRQLEPVANKHVAAAEERIAATASRQVKDEISRRLKRIADDG
jgi:hypothetical protein